MTAPARTPAWLSSRPWHRVGLSAVGLCLALCTGFLGASEETVRGSAETTPTLPTALELAAVREALEPLNFDQPAPHSKAVSGYLDFYGLLTTQHEHLFGTFRSGPHVIAAHLYRPESPRGTVVLMHGFLDHVGTLSSTVQHLLGQGFAVAAYDQLGHGLSSGPRASVDDFAQYASIFEDFLQICRAHMPPPYHSIAHSTGAAIVADHLLRNGQDDLGQVVFIAPLVRSAYWDLSTSVTPVAELFTSELPRVFRKNSSDEQFLEFMRRDPLQPRRTSIAWFNALVDWNERIKSYPPNPRSLVIIQGDADSIVDWEYNVDFLTTKFPNARVEIIETGRHQLLNEAPKLRSQVVRIIDDVLSVEPKR